VMNKQKIEDEKMNQLLKIAMGSGPKEILRRLREIDGRVGGSAKGERY
jgi:hypothetical protein